MMMMMAMMMTMTMMVLSVYVTFMSVRWLGLHALHVQQLKAHFRSACCALSFSASDTKKMKSLLKCPDTAQVEFI